MKKVLSLLMVLCLVVGMVPVAASAAGSSEKTEDSVALVDGMYYDNFSEAIESAIEKNTTLTLLANASVSQQVKIPSDATVILNLGDYTLTCPNEFKGWTGLVENSGKLTITGNGKLDASIPSVAGIMYAVYNKSGATLIVDSGIIKGGTREAIHNSDGTVNISGGQIIAEKGNQYNVAISTYKGEVTVSGDAAIQAAYTGIKASGSKVTISENASVTGQFGVILLNENADNERGKLTSSLTMNGGSIVSKGAGFALSGNNLQSAQCSAEITGGKLEQTSGETCIYWPMEGNLTIGGNAVVEGGSAIEAKMGTITIKGNAQLVGSGSYIDEAPLDGGSQADGSAILVSSQIYGAAEGQYITSPDLTITIEGGTLTSKNGNAVTVYNKEKIEKQTAEVTISGGTLRPAEGKAVVQVTNEKADSNVAKPDEQNGNYSVKTSASKTTVTISSEVAGFAADLGTKTGFYNTLSDALTVAGGVKDKTTVYMMEPSDDKIDRGALGANVTLTAVKGVTPQLYSEEPNSVIKQTKNDDGTTTYTVVTKDDESSGDSIPEITLPTVNVTADKTTAYQGDTITLTATLSSTSNSPQIIWYKDGEVISNQTGTTLTVTESGVYYAVVRVSQTGGDGAVYSEEKESNHVTCTIGGTAPSIPTTPTYANTVSDTENGKVTASPTRPKEGATVTITTTPDKGYEVGSVSVTDADGKAVAVTNAGNGKYTFKQPDSKVTIKVTFVWDNPFTDVKSTAWYYNAVKYVYENNLMAGTGDTTFDPEVSLTRAMTAQILYNLEGQPKVDEEATFSDMTEAPTWSVDAIAWAQDTGVVAGMGDNEFAPNAKVTREQFAQMMYNYAKYKKYDLTKTGDLSKFPDDGSVSDWAETAMSWANGNGLINGHEDSGLIDPAGNTIRGQAASIIMNFNKNVVK